MNPTSPTSLPVASSSDCSVALISSNAPSSAKRRFVFRVVCPLNQTRMSRTNNMVANAKKSFVMHSSELSLTWTGLTGTVSTILWVPIMTDCVSRDLYAKGNGVIECVYLSATAVAYAVVGKCTNENQFFFHTLRRCFCRFWPFKETRIKTPWTSLHYVAVVLQEDTWSFHPQTVHEHCNRIIQTERWLTTCLSLFYLAEHGRHLLLFFSLSCHCFCSFHAGEISEITGSYVNALQFLSASLMVGALTGLSDVVLNLKRSCYRKEYNVSDGRI